MTLQYCFECRGDKDPCLFSKKSSRICQPCLQEFHNKKNQLATSKIEKRRKYANEYDKMKRRTDPHFRAIKNARIRLYMALRHGLGKKARTSEYLGCNWDTFIKHLESKFQSGMTWQNYGMFGWHVDHIKPIFQFDRSNPEELKKAFHYTNLQPLWCHDNWSKNRNFFK